MTCAWYSALLVSTKIKYVGHTRHSSAWHKTSYCMHACVLILPVYCTYPNSYAMIHCVHSVFISGPEKLKACTRHRKTIEFQARVHRALRTPMECSRARPLRPGPRLPYLVSEGGQWHWAAAGASACHPTHHPVLPPGARHLRRHHAPGPRPGAEPVPTITHGGGPLLVLAVVV